MTDPHECEDREEPMTRETMGGGGRHLPRHRSADDARQLAAMYDRIVKAMTE